MLAVLSLAQVDVLAVEKLLLHAWLTGWLPVIVMEVLAVVGGLPLTHAAQQGGALIAHCT